VASEFCVEVKKLREISESFLSNYSFNQDFSCFCLSTSTGFRTFTLDPLTEFSRRIMEPVNIASMLYQTNYLALVLKSAPYKVLLWDDSLRQKPHEVWSRFEILNVLLRRDILAVVSEYKIYIYEFGSFAVLMHMETFSNPKGVAVVTTEKPWVIATLGNTKGVIKLQWEDATTFEIAAHSHGISNLAICGNLVASASETGTVIKVFDIKSGNLMYSLRRGTTSCKISCLNFRSDSKFLVAASAGSNTVHVFKLEAPGSSGSSAVGANLTVSQENPVSFLQGTRSLVQFKLPDVDQNGKPAVDLRFTQWNALSGPIACFSKSDSQKIFVLHFNGVLYEGNFDPDSNNTSSELPLKAHVIFAARPDFKIGASSTPDDEEGHWNVL
jgi:WD repeat-containing protein 45